MVPPNESNPPRPPLPSFFLSLPEDIVLSILARISRSYYPTLSLVSKSFHSMILSNDLDMVRSHLGTREECVYVCFQTPTHTSERRWFSLWIKPDDHQALTLCNSEFKRTGNWLLQLPSSYSPRLPIILKETIGSDTYEIGGQNTISSSTDVWVYNKLTGKQHKAPSMTVARRNALTCSFEGKLYVMGGCESDESTHWAEVFDPKTNTWEPLPDPGTDLRFSPIKKLQGHEGKVYVRSNKNNFVYLIKESRWEVVKINMGESMCEIDKVRYGYCDEKCLWYDTNCEKWRLVKGLTGFDAHWRIQTEIGHCGGKLIIVWVGPPLHPLIYTPEVWCSVILLEKRTNGEVWGHIEWTDHVLTVPQKYTLLHCMSSLQ